MLLYTANENLPFKNKLYTSADTRNKFFCGSVISKKKLKNALTKTSKALKKFSDLKNNLGKKLIHKAATNDTVSNFIESIPVVGDALNTTIKVSDKAIRKAEDITDKIKKKEYTKKDFKDDLKKIKSDEDVIKMKDKIVNWFNNNVKDNTKLNDTEKEDIKEKLDSLDLNEAAKLGDKAPLAGLLTTKKSKTLKAKYRKALGITQKTLSNNGRLFLSGGNCSGRLFLSSGKAEPKHKTKKYDDIYNTLFN
jgi:hypothetical protein